MASLPPLAYPAFTLARTRFTPARLRLRIPSRRSDAAYFRHLQGELRKVPGVLEAQADPRTGSLLLVHDRKERALLAKLDGLRLFRYIPAGEVSFAERRGPSLELNEQDKLALRLAVYGGLAGLQLLRGQALEPASKFLRMGYQAWRSARYGGPPPEDID